VIVRIDCAPADRDPVPVRLWLGERPVEVVEIVDQWPGTDHRYVKLRGGDGALYIVRHEPARGAWELILYQAPDRLPGEAG
jgi:hypothetical protein